MLERIQPIADRIVENVGRVIIGKRTEVELALIGILSQGHLLIEDVPGVGKTMLARSLAISLGGSFRRIQFTPDMLPSDVTGVSIFNQQSREFEFRSGPIVAQIVLADEINRATPKTQAALLEAMDERQVTVDGVTHRLPEPFLVLATQNPIEYEGTFPLPEAQLDRFLMRISLGYPILSEEVRILESQQLRHPVETLQQVTDAREFVDAQMAVREVYVDPLVKHYIVDLVNNTRRYSDVYLGASPRGSLGLMRTSQARAATRGRDYVTPDDVKALAIPVLAHRLLLEPSARLEGTTSAAVLQEILGSVAVPGGDLRRPV
ncbi:MAG: MoxR family ATPase [Anaerolineales bacterium]|jgi:MoxR-like ATPase